MKKILFAVLIAATFGLTSCSKKEACYKVTASFMGVSSSTYVWGTKADVDTVIDEAKKQMGGTGVTVTSSKVSKSESDCVGVALD
jgi:hypothetical protein